MGRKKGTSVVQKAIDTVPGFAGLWHKVSRKMRLTGNSEKTLLTYGRSLAQMAVHFGCSPETVDEESVMEYLYGLVQDRELSDSYYKFTVFGLRYAYKALGMEVKRLSLPEIKKKQQLPGVLSKQDCKRLFAAPRPLKHKVLLSLIYSAGLRMNEARMLQPRDIDSDRMQIHIRGGKGGKDRYVPLSRVALIGLRKYFKECRPQKYLFEGQMPGEPMGERSMQYILKQAVKAAGLRRTDITLHTLRHSYATHMLEEGVDIVTIKEQLGHTRLDTTLVYLHIARVGRKPPHSPLDTLYGPLAGTAGEGF
jgi:integrase/recombinase XerD